MIGALACGPIANALGRKPATLLCSIPYVLGTIFMISASSSLRSLFVIGRFLIGIGIGYSSVIGPLYIAEIAPASLRGTLGGVSQCKYSKITWKSQRYAASKVDSLASHANASNLDYGFVFLNCFVDFCQYSLFMIQWVCVLGPLSYPYWAWKSLSNHGGGVRCSSSLFCSSWVSSYPYSCWHPNPQYGLWHAASWIVHTPVWSVCAAFPAVLATNFNPWSCVQVVNGCFLELFKQLFSLLI